MLGGDRLSEKDNPPKRAKATVGRQTAAATRFNHYSTGHGFWVSSSDSHRCSCNGVIDHICMPIAETDS